MQFCKIYQRVSKPNKANRLIINYGEWGATKWENLGSETFCEPPPPSKQGKTFRFPPFKEWKLLVPPPPPPLSIWVKLPQNFLCPAFSMAKSFSAPPFRPPRNLIVTSP